MLVFAFRSEIWNMQNFNFTVSKDFCLSLSWKYRFLQNENHAKVQSKTNKYCKFHVDQTRRRLSKSRFKKLGMVPKKTVSKHLNIKHTHRTLRRRTLSFCFVTFRLRLCCYSFDFVVKSEMNPTYYDVSKVN